MTTYEKTDDGKIRVIETTTNTTTKELSIEDIENNLKNYQDILDREVNHYEKLVASIQGNIDQMKLLLTKATDFGIAADNIIS